MTGRERRGVELVLGVQDERDIECFDLLRRRFGVTEHEEEVRGLAEVLAGRDGEQSLREAEVIGDGDGDLREQALGLAKVCVVRIVCCILIEVAERGDRGAESVERSCPLGQAPRSSRSGGGRRRAAATRDWKDAS